MVTRTWSRVVFATFLGLVSLTVAHIRLTMSTALADPELMIIRPPTGEGSGTGNFTNLDNAIDEVEFSGSVGQVDARCSSSCLNTATKSAEWQGFPDGYEPERLEVRWEAIGGISLASGRHSKATLKLEVDYGNGYVQEEYEEWIDQIPSCQNNNLRCVPHWFVKQLNADTQSSGAIKVKVTVTIQMTTCANCGIFDTSHMTVFATVRDIRLQVRPPRLVATPNPLTRGDTLTLQLRGAPGGTISGWKYTPTEPLGIVTRTINTSSATWSGTALVSGEATVHVVHNSVAYDPKVEVVVNPRPWNTTSEPPDQRTDLMQMVSPIQDPGPGNTVTLGYSAWNFVGAFATLKLGADGPNRGYSYVEWVKHSEDVDTYFRYQIHPEINPGETFYVKQCGMSPFILGSVLRSNIFEHEGGSVKGHYQQYKDQLTLPYSNYGLVAEPLLGSISQTIQAFTGSVNSAMTTISTDLESIADQEACNQLSMIDTSCVNRGALNYYPYSPPCQ